MVGREGEGRLPNPHEFDQRGETRESRTFRHLVPILLPGINQTKSRRNLLCLGIFAVVQL